MELFSNSKPVRQLLKKTTTIDQQDVHKNDFAYGKLRIKIFIFFRFFIKIILWIKEFLNNSLRHTFKNTRWRYSYLFLFIQLW